MKRALSCVLALAMITAYQLPLLAAAQNTGEISGMAVVEGKPLSNAMLRLRNVESGQIAGTTSTNAQGAFRFTGLPAGNYVVEVVEPTVRLVGTSARISLAAGSMTANGVTVTTSAAAGAAGGGGGFFTSTLGIVTLAAIGAGVTIGIVAATGDASPSR